MLDDLLTYDWTWRSFGGPLMLVTQRGGAKVVLCADEARQIRTRDHQGILVPLRADAPIAHVIASTPKMHAALTEVDRCFAAWGRPPASPEWQKMIEGVRVALAQAEGRNA